jgi:hypothetical protein
MCMDSVGRLLVQDETIQRLMSNPILELIHKQVVLTLYSLDAERRLNEYKELLPIYLSMDWNKCRGLLDTIQRAGLLALQADEIHLTHPIKMDGVNICGCR